MAVTIPTIAQIKQAILNDYATEFDVDVNQLGDTYNVEASVKAAVIYTFYLSLSDVQRNVFYDTAESDQLIRYGQIILGRTPAQATAGQYTMQVTGEIGAVIPASTQFKANDSTQAAGFLFIVDNAYTLVATTDTVPIRALTAGTEARLFANDLLTSTTPLALVESEGIVLSTDVEPTAAESIEEYRADVLEASRLTAQGGSPSDYRLWASDIPEVRTVYPYAKLGSAGDVEVYIEATKENTAPAEVPGVPTQTTINEVYTPQAGATPESGALVFNPVTNRGRKPITVFNLLVFPVNPISVDLFFVNLSDELISDDIRTAIDNLLYNIRPYVAGASSITNKNDILNISTIIAEVTNLLAGTGITYTSLTMEVGGVAVDTKTFTAGDYPYLNIINNDGNPI